MAARGPGSVGAKSMIREARLVAIEPPSVAAAAGAGAAAAASASLQRLRSLVHPARARAAIRMGRATRMAADARSPPRMRSPGAGKDAGSRRSWIDEAELPGGRGPPARAASLPIALAKNPTPARLGRRRRTTERKPLGA